MLNLTPLPGGEGLGEGVRRLEDNPERPTPPNLPLKGEEFGASGAGGLRAASLRR